MFTGIIETTGIIRNQTTKGGDVRLDVEMASLDLTDVKMGDSIAINGVCLTVVDFNGPVLSFDVSKETLDRTSLGALSVNSKVNLEKALAVGDRLGGHMVSGHVDAMAECTLRQMSARSVQFEFLVPEELSRYIAEKGSICIDGVSLTVNKVTGNSFEVNIIPHTMQETIIQDYGIGTKVNIEVDLIARYLERLLPSEQSSGVTMQTLQQHGFIK